MHNHCDIGQHFECLTPGLSVIGQHFECLAPGLSVISQQYCDQLEKLAQTVHTECSRLGSVIG